MIHCTESKTQQKQASLAALNQRIRNCQKCPLFSTREHAIVGEGEADSRLMFIALSPGKNEDSENRMFIGPSGRVLDTLLASAEIDREAVYMTNLIKCTLPKNRKPKMAEITYCSYFLDKEIEIVRPEVIVPLGYYATRAMLLKYHATSPASRADVTPLYGMLIFSEGQKLFPLPHPASLLYNPTFEEETKEKYKKLNVFMHECTWYPSCPLKRYYEAGRLERRWIELYCQGDWQKCVRYELEERGHYHPDCMLPDGSLDEQLEME